MLLIAGDSFGIKEHELVEKQRARLIFDAYGAMGAAVYAPGDRDFLYGDAFLKNLDANHAIAVLCANIDDRRPSSDAFTSHLVVDRGGQRVLITAVVGTQTQLYESGANLTITDPVAAIRNIQGRVEHDLFIVMAYVNQATAETWLRKVDGIDLMVVGDQAGIRTGLKVVNGGGIVYSNVKGSSLSYVDWSPDSGAGQSDFSPPVHHSIVAIEHAESPLIKAMIDEYKENVKSIMRTRQPKGREKPVLVARDGFFVGDKWCIRCHRGVYDSWKQSPHAHAMETLEKAGKADDPACLKCHTTGMNNQQMWFARARAGFTDAVTTPHLLDVQCESCHGPAQQHTLAPEKYTFYKVGPNNCKRCHTSMRDPDFAFLRDKVKGTHIMGEAAKASKGDKNDAPAN